MGMAASQARYLALVARKSNCEYEGQQINQARTALSNQSANLFNQMLGLSVPIPPSTQDFTKVQYSYTDGFNESTIDSWQQLSSTDPDYNYVVTHHYYTEQYTGSQKMLNDPQVQFYNGIPTISTSSDYTTNISQIQEALKKYIEAEKALELAETAQAMQAVKAANINSYSETNTYNNVTSCIFSDNKYTLNNNSNLTFTKYEPNNTNSPHSIVTELLGTMEANGVKNINTDLIYVDSNGNFAFKSDLDALVGGKTILPIYSETSISSVNGDLVTANENLSKAKKDFYDAEDAYEKLEVPSYVGNSKLTCIAELTKDQEAEIKQIIADMEAQEINSNLSNCFSLDEAGNPKYDGGIYSFNLNGITYYTTYYDLVDAANSGTGINNIDDQHKLPYYNATYVSTKVEKTEKALIETDGNGRFSSIRFEDDSMTYSLQMETITDDVAYQDAMNQYYYENAKYDKMVQDINAKTSIIQHEDQQLELRLKQLDTEQKALSTEMEAVKKVVDSNVESTFKTFNG